MFCFLSTGHVIIYNTLENCFFQILSYSRAYLRIIYEKTKGQVPLEPLLGKQNTQAKGVYYMSDCKTVGFFLKISKEIGKAWCKIITRAKRASLPRLTLFSTSFQTFRLTARAYLNKQKYELFCSLITCRLY